MRRFVSTKIAASPRILLIRFIKKFPSPLYALFHMIVSAYTPNGKAKYKAICLKLIAKTMAITASSTYPSNMNPIPQITNPCIT